MVQVFVKCGGPIGTLAVDVCFQRSAVQDIKASLCSAQRLPDPARMVVTFAGKVLRDSMPLAAVPGLRSASTLHLTYRLPGGGGDGGSTGAESRSSYLEMYLEKKPDKVNPAEELLAKWSTCHLSNEPLRPPCVMDELGFVYNKEAILHHLLHKTMPAQLSYISSLKHVLELKLERSNPQSQASSSQRSNDQSSFQLLNGAEFGCPVTGLPLNGRSRFVALRPSGLVVSEKALKECKAVVQELAGAPWSDSDVAQLNPTGEVLDALKAKVAARLGAERQKKLDRKLKKSAGEAADASAVRVATGAPSCVRSTSPPPLDVVAPSAKRPKAAEAIPRGATKEVYNSLFLSGAQYVEKETYCCRALSARGMKMGS